MLELEYLERLLRRFWRHPRFAPSADLWAAGARGTRPMSIPVAIRA